jgi:biopolymer transport protein ExbB
MDQVAGLSMVINSLLSPGLQSLAQMNVTAILSFADTAIWVAITLAAAFGVYCVVLLTRRVSQKGFPGLAAEQAFVEDVSERLAKNDFEGVVQLCDTPELWSRAVPQLVQIGIQNRELPLKKIRQLLGQRFERDILASLENTAAWVGTVIKIAPMLGLLGTVVGMINAFKKIAGAADSGIDPAALAGDISFALWTTAAGLSIAIPLVTMGASAAVKMGKLQESVRESLGTILDDLEAAKIRTGR